MHQWARLGFNVRCRVTERLFERVSAAAYESYSPTTMSDISRHRFGDFTRARLSGFSVLGDHAAHPAGRRSRRRDGRTGEAAVPATYIIGQEAVASRRVRGAGTAAIPSGAAPVARALSGARRIARRRCSPSAGASHGMFAGAGRIHAPDRAGRASWNRADRGGDGSARRGRGLAYKLRGEAPWPWRFSATARWRKGSA